MIHIISYFVTLAFIGVMQALAGYVTFLAFVALLGAGSLAAVFMVQGRMERGRRRAMSAPPGLNRRVS